MTDLTVHIDGGSRGNPGPAGAGVVIADARGKAVFEAGFFLGRMTNNQAEYRALLRAIEALTALQAENFTIFSDSELMVRQLTGAYRVRSADLRPLFEEAQQGLLRCTGWQIRHVPREQNRRADQLANRAMDEKADVVETDLRGRGLSGRPNGGAPAGRSRATPSEASAGDTPQPPIVVARVVMPPDDEACPVPCPAGREWSFGATVPENLCINAAHTLLQTVLALQHVPHVDAAEPVRPMKVRCLRADCHAVFEVRVHS